jgi:hypothetical protein
MSWWIKKQQTDLSSCIFALKASIVCYEFSAKNARTEDQIDELHQCGSGLIGRHDHNKKHKSFFEILNDLYLTITFLWLGLFSGQVVLLILVLVKLKPLLPGLHTCNYWTVHKFNWFVNFITDPRVLLLGPVLKFYHDWDERDIVLNASVSLSRINFINKGLLNLLTYFICSRDVYLSLDLDRISKQRTVVSLSEVSTRGTSASVGFSWQYLCLKISNYCVTSPSTSQ